MCGLTRELISHIFHAPHIHCALIYPHQNLCVRLIVACHFVYLFVWSAFIHWVFAEPLLASVWRVRACLICVFSHNRWRVRVAAAAIAARMLAGYLFALRSYVARCSVDDLGSFDSTTTN